MAVSGDSWYWRTFDEHPVVTPVVTIAVAMVVCLGLIGWLAWLTRPTCWGSEYIGKVVVPAQMLGKVWIPKHEAHGFRCADGREVTVPVDMQ